MKLKTNDLITDLLARTLQVVADAVKLGERSLSKLEQRSGPNEWNALECIQHLNLYGNYYLPEIQKALLSKKHLPEPVFKSGILGDYFAKMMLPGERAKKIKTFRDKDPLGEKLDAGVIEQFIWQQQKLMKQLERSSSVSLNKTRIPLSFGKYIKLRLGDIFRIVIYHNQRHMLQAKNAVEMESVR